MSTTMIAVGGGSTNSGSSKIRDTPSHTTTTPTNNANAGMKRDIASRVRTPGAAPVSIVAETRGASSSTMLVMPQAPDDDLPSKAGEAAPSHARIQAPSNFP